MARRSITLWPILERHVREYQASLLKRLDCDVSFTEALNLMLLNAFLKKGTTEEALGIEAIKQILDSTDLSKEALLDNLQDGLFQEAVKQALETKR